VSVSPRIIAATLGVVATLAGPAGPAGATGSDPSQLPSPCLVGEEVRGFAQDLPNTRAAVAALGSSSTQGARASSDDRTYPSVLQDELRRLLPRLDVKVVNAGVGSNSAHQMFLRLEHDVIGEEPKLVVWQTGIIDAIHDVGIDRFKRVLRKGIARLREAGTDVVLMDHQPLPNSARYQLYREYMAALREVAAEAGVPVFRRYDVMSELIGSGRLRMDEIFTTDALTPIDRGYYCLAANLAETLAAKLAPREEPAPQR
jgi:acyl-CoA thioesterase-1